MKKRMFILMAGVLGITTVFTSCNNVKANKEVDNSIVFGTSQTCYNLLW